MDLLREFKIPTGTTFLIEDAQVWYEPNMRTPVKGEPTGLHSYFFCPKFESYPEELRGDEELFKMNFFRSDQSRKLSEEDLGELIRDVIKFIQ